MTEPVLRGVDPYRMTAEEIASGWVPGGVVGEVPVFSRSAGTPVEALEDAIRPALRAPGPCVIEFSGGRDSSIVLAVAHRLAVREGLDLPVAFTRRYPGLPEADEDEWQELVVRHLGVTEWVICPATDEVDLLGPVARASLRRWGVLWPPLVHTRRTELELARGGTLMSGEGGDEIFGAHRLTVLRQLAGRKIPWTQLHVRQAALGLAPRGVREDKLSARMERRVGFPWLQAETRARMVRALTADTATEPLNWRTAVRQHPYTRPVSVALETMALLSAEADVVRSQPLLSAAFLDAVCAAGGLMGFVGRTTAMRQLFGDLLPDALLARTDKCWFNRAVFGTHSRAFVARWSGGGVDPSMVDADALREVWTADEPNAMTFALLQSCWLATEGGVADA